MSFTDFSFWLIFPVIFIVYWTLPAKINAARKVFLLFVSYLLYLNCDPSFSIVLASVTIVTYFGGRILSIKSGKAALCWLFSILGLLPLLVFKYYNFINSSINTSLECCGLHFSLPGLNWAIPIGISFFTFQAVGYLLDVYHKRCAAEKNIIDYFLFVSFFPQIVSGPISSANELMPQIKNPHKFDYGQGKRGLELLLWGMFLKLVIADRLGLYVNLVLSHYSLYSGLSCLKALLYYSIQIYCDFAGYSLMAVGIARTLGFELIDNFRRPYFAASVTEFWKRWHISLTRWLTTHIYIGLGGNRCSRFRQYLNIMVTFLVSGLWHGANWTFVLWGVIHGLFQIIEKSLFGEKIRAELKSGIHNFSISRCLRITLTFFAVSFAWIFFRMPSVGDGWNLIVRIIGMTPGKTTTGSLLFVAIFGIVILFLHEFRIEFGLRLSYIPQKWKSAFRWICCMVMFILILLYGVLDSGSFIYASF